jgi:hypothetical protein
MRGGPGPLVEAVGMPGQTDQDGSRVRTGVRAGNGRPALSSRPTESLPVAFDGSFRIARATEAARLSAGTCELQQVVRTAPVRGSDLLKVCTSSPPVPVDAPVRESSTGEAYGKPPASDPA